MSVANGNIVFNRKNTMIDNSCAWSKPYTYMIYHQRFIVRNTQALKWFNDNHKIEWKEVIELQRILLMISEAKAEAVE